LHTVLTHSWPPEHCESSEHVEQAKPKHTWPAGQFEFCTHEPTWQKPNKSQTRPSPHVVPATVLAGVQALQVKAVGEVGTVSHSRWPPEQSTSEWQTPVTHEPATQIFPVTHWVSRLQLAQVRAVHTLPGASVAQSAVVTQLPGWQSWSASQTLPAGQSAVVVQPVQVLATHS
jgi:hypothetical protein